MARTVLGVGGLTLEEHDERGHERRPLDGAPVGVVQGLVDRSDDELTQGLVGGPDRHGIPVTEVDEPTGGGVGQGPGLGERVREGTVLGARRGVTRLAPSHSAVVEHDGPATQQVDEGLGDVVRPTAGEDEVGEPVVGGGGPLDPGGVAAHGLVRRGQGRERLLGLRQRTHLHDRDRGEGGEGAEQRHLVVGERAR